MRVDYSFLCPRKQTQMRVCEAFVGGFWCWCTIMLSTLNKKVANDLVFHKMCFVVWKTLVDKLFFFSIYRLFLCLFGFKYNVLVCGFPQSALFWLST